MAAAEGRRSRSEDREQAQAEAAASDDAPTEGEWKANKDGTETYRQPKGTSPGEAAGVPTPDPPEVTDRR